MTDRNKINEIEDVLSSIRKLVSDDVRPMPIVSGPLAGGPVIAASDAAATRRTVPRLVLTPALRVSPDDQSAGRSGGTGPAEVTPGVSDDGLATRLAELELLMAGQNHSFEDDLPGPVAAPQAPLVLVSLPDKARVAPEPGPDLVRDAVPEAPFLSDIDDMVDGDRASGEMASEAGASDDMISDVMAADGPDAMSWLAAPQEAQRGDNGADPLAMLDDAMLRDLIRDVLREELQGDMGERVTRNLRKLVRTEIARALTARGIA